MQHPYDFPLIDLPVHRVQDFLTVAQIKRCIELWEMHRVTHRLAFHEAVLHEIIEPNIDTINGKLGRDTSPRFLACAIQFALARL